MRKMRAYMTLEASMVMPVVLWVVVFTVYLMFFQYDRCLWQQHLQTVALRSVTSDGGAAPTLSGSLSRMERLEKSGDEREYLAWERGETCCDATLNAIVIEGEGRLKFPFRIAEQNKISKIGSGWSVKIRVREHIPDPVFFIRSCRRLKGGNQ